MHCRWGVPFNRGIPRHARNDGLFWILRVSVFCGDHLRRDEGIPPYGALILLPIVSTGRHIGRPLPVNVRFGVGATLRGRPFVLREIKEPRNGAKDSSQARNDIF